MAAIVESECKESVPFKDVFLVSILFAGCLIFVLQGLKDIYRGEVAFGIFELIVCVAPSCIHGHYLITKSVRSFLMSLLMACGWLVCLGLFVRAFS